MFELKLNFAQFFACRHLDMSFFVIVHGNESVIYTQCMFSINNLLLIFLLLLLISLLCILQKW